MASVSGFALSPSPATSPLTVTCPASIISSALRREAMPALARIFWSRSSLMGLGLFLPLFQVGDLPQVPFLAVLSPGLDLVEARRQSAHLDGARHGAGVAGAEGLLELLERRQVFEAVEPEVDEELPRRAVEEGLADHLLAADDAHQPPLEQGLEHPRRADAAQLLDLGAGHRLPVGDDRQGLQRRHRELVPARDVE